MKKKVTTQQQRGSQPRLLVTLMTSSILFLLLFLIVLFVGGLLSWAYPSGSSASFSSSRSSASASGEDEENLEEMLFKLENDKNFIKETIRMERERHAKVATSQEAVALGAGKYEEKITELEYRVDRLMSLVIGNVPAGEQARTDRSIMTEEQGKQRLLKRLAQMEERIKMLSQAGSGQKVTEVQQEPATVPNSGSSEVSSESSTPATTTEAPVAAISTDSTGSNCPSGTEYSPHCKTCMKVAKSYKDKINFVHIPKAAGSALTISVRNYLNCQPTGKGCWGDPVVTVQGNIDCGGKLTGCYGLNPLRNQNSVVMLREPLSRIASAFVDRQFPSGAVENKAKAKATNSIEEYMAIPGISNCQAKILLGKSCTDLHVVGDADIAKVQSRIEHVEVLGIMEHFNTSVCLLYHTLGGLPKEEDFQYVKKSAHKHVLTQKEEEVARLSEAKDLLAYDIAKKSFEKRLQNYGQPFVD